MKLVSVGETLTRARQERGLSVEDVTAATRIRAGLIRSIESDDFAPCGGALYARGRFGSSWGVAETDPAPPGAEFAGPHAGEAPPQRALVPGAAIDPEVAHAEPK